jgi:hypothetical protein
VTARSGESAFGRMAAIADFCGKDRFWRISGIRRSSGFDPSNRSYAGRRLRSLQYIGRALRLEPDLQVIEATPLSAGHPSAVRRSGRCINQKEMSSSEIGQ